MRAFLQRGRVAAAGAALAAALGAGEAGAQFLPDGQGYSLRLFRNAVDTKGQFVVNGTDILGHLDYAFGLTVDYGRGLARLGIDSPVNGVQPMSARTNLVEHMLTGVFSAGLGLGNWVALGVQFPVVLMGGPSGDAMVGGYSTPMNMGVSFQGLGDFAFNVKVRFLRSERLRFGLAAVFQLGVPMGTPGRSFAGEPAPPQVYLWPSLVLEVRPVNLFRIDASIGYRHWFGQGATLTPAYGDPATYGRPLTAGLGASVRLGSTPVELVAETYLEQYVNGIGNSRSLPWEAVGGLKIFVLRNSYLLMGGGGRIPLGDAPAAANLRVFLGFMLEPSIPDTDGDGLRDDVDRCPLQPEDFDGFQDGDGCPDPDNDQDGIPDVRDQCPNVPEDRDGDHDNDGCPEGDTGDRDGDGIPDAQDQCPNDPEDRDQFQDDDGCPDPDNDNDGIPDTADRCPNDPEDRDGFEDEDGCPDPDNDHDRIPDSRDRCPNEPETYNGEQDEDGCPDTGVVALEEGQIRILQAINFETNSARIRPDSIRIVEAVARTLVSNQQIRLLEVQGHADERGDDNHNLQLTRDRAASVVEALVERGVERSRLHSAGYGELCRAGFPARPGQDPINSECQGTGRGGARWCHSERAWSRDRRVVFLILETSEGPTRVRIACPGAEQLIPEADRPYHNPEG